MRVELAQHLADDGRALAEPGVGIQVQVVVHRVQDPPLHRLEPVAHVRQRARGDDADGIVEVPALRLVRQRGIFGPWGPPSRPSPPPPPPFLPPPHHPRPPRREARPP